MVLHHALVNLPLQGVNVGGSFCFAITDAPMSICSQLASMGALSPLHSTFAQACQETSVGTVSNYFDLVTEI